MRAEEVHSRIQPTIKAALIERADQEGVTLSKLIAKVLTQATNRWATANSKKAKA